MRDGNAALPNRRSPISRRGGQRARTRRSCQWPALRTERKLNEALRYSASYSLPGARTADVEQALAIYRQAVTVPGRLRSERRICRYNAIYRDERSLPGFEWEVLSLRSTRQRRRAIAQEQASPRLTSIEAARRTGGAVRDPVHDFPQRARDATLVASKPRTGVRRGDRRGRRFLAAFPTRPDGSRFPAMADAFAGGAGARNSGVRPFAPGAAVYWPIGCRLVRHAPAEDGGRPRPAEPGPRIRRVLDSLHRAARLVAAAYRRHRLRRDRTKLRTIRGYAEAPISNRTPTAEGAGL